MSLLSRKGSEVEFDNAHRWLSLREIIAIFAEQKATIGSAVRLATIPLTTYI